MANLAPASSGNSSSREAADDALGGGSLFTEHRPSGTGLPWWPAWPVRGVPGACLAARPGHRATPGCMGSASPLSRPRRDFDQAPRAPAASVREGSRASEPDAPAEPRLGSHALPPHPLAEPSARPPRGTGLRPAQEGGAAVPSRTGAREQATSSICLLPSRTPRALSPPAFPPSSGHRTCYTTCGGLRGTVTL